MISQDDIDRLAWYHDFEFPNGLRARSTETRHTAVRRILQWFVSEQVRSVNVTGKRVLDVGCWDGYYSFLAEERGAKSVLAVDDASQNWGSTECFQLARDLKRSSVTFRPDVSIYQLSQALRETFDVVLLLGVYYHLHAPYMAFAQIRAVCHDDSIVLIEGDCIRDDERAYAEHDYRDPRTPTFIPTTRLLREMLHSCYFDVERMAFPSDVEASQLLALVSPAEVLRIVAQHRRTQRAGQGRSTTSRAQPVHERVVIFARPFRGRNDAHKYPPPFGLGRFDGQKGFDA